MKTKMMDKDKIPKTHTHEGVIFERIKKLI